MLTSQGLGAGVGVGRVFEKKNLPVRRQRSKFPPAVLLSAGWLGVGSAFSLRPVSLSLGCPDGLLTGVMASALLSPLSYRPENPALWRCSA